MDIEIRTARSDDRGPIAELVYSSGTDIYDYLYKERVLDFLRYEFASGVGYCGHPNVTVAVLGGEVVGTGCFFDRARYDRLLKGSGKNILGFFGPLGAPAVLWRSRHVGSVMRPPAPDEVYLSNFGVAPHLRSQGIGTRMIEAKAAEARAAGHRILGLDVSTGNPRGQALYTRLGFVVKEEKVFSDPNAGVHSARKMELALDGPRTGPSPASPRTA